MPYYFGEDSPDWEEVITQLELQPGAATPREKFTFIDPWQTKAALVHFPRTPTVPPAPPCRKSLFERIFGGIFKETPAASRASPPAPEPEAGSDAWFDKVEALFRGASDAALLRVAALAAALREAGVCRLLIRYDGGNDEGFTYFEAVEMADGRRLTGEDRTARKVVAAALRTVHGDSSDIDRFERDAGSFVPFDDAAIAFLGPGFGTGPFFMFGAITIDCEACLMTDDADPVRAFGPERDSP